MNNFIFKSANGLLKKSSNTHLELLIENKLEMLLTEQRHQRCDLNTLSKKIDRLLIDKHLQMQVDEYFTEDRPDNEDKEPD